MMQTNRIPLFAELSFDGMLRWFAEMSVGGLLFHPDDAPEEIIEIASDRALFSSEECQTLTDILSRMFTAFGDGVYEAAYPIMMKQAGLQLDA